jgi:PAS domain S-box-containing protein
VTIVLVILAVATAAAWIFSQHQKQRFTKRIAHELRLVADLKAEQLSRMYVDERNDIDLIAASRTVATLYDQWKETGRGADRDALAGQLASLADQHGYRDLFICNGDGARYMPDQWSVEQCDEQLRRVVVSALESNTEQATDLYWCTRHADIHFDFVAPLGKSRHRAVIVGRFQARTMLFPMTMLGAHFSRSAESYLLRKERDSVRVLTPLRFRPHAELMFAVPARDTSSALVRATMKRSGKYEGLDYRGTAVIGYTRPVKSTPWFIVAEVDRAEVFDEMYVELVLLVALVMTLMLTVIIGVWQYLRRRQHELYRSMFEDHAAVILLIDTKDGQIVDANPAAARFYGWPREHLLRMRIDEINTLPREEVRQHIKSSVVETVFRHEYRHRLADGSIRDVEVFAGPLRIHGREFLHSIVTDVTEKKRAEQSLRMLGRSVEQSPVTIVITNLDGVIEYVNPEFTRVTGFTAEDVLGKKTSVLGSGYHSSEFYAELWGTILSGKDWIGEFRNRRKSGEEFWERAIISPVFDQKGNITHFLGVKSDISEEKRLLAELVQAKERAEESDRLKSTFLANMSHEIRTPINTVVGFAELLLDPAISPDDRTEFSDVIRQRSYDLLNIINDILDFSRIEAGEVSIVVEECSVHDILEDLQRTYSHTPGHDGVPVSLHNELGGDDDHLVTDAARVRQVLTNLLSNAVKFTHEGEITFGCRKINEEEILFYVRDTGIGIPEDLRAIIFDRFRQADESTSRRYGGTGLGLAICQGIVQLLGGRIWVESTPGRGSIFQFTVPRRTVMPEMR